MADFLFQVSSSESTNLGKKNINLGGKNISIKESHKTQQEGLMIFHIRLLNNNIESALLTTYHVIFV